jgi:hypothetical protein
MITVRQFVGAMLEEVTKARAISDAASARIAQQYLNHDLLKGFPVPRMHVRELEIELCFAVGGGTQDATIFGDEEIRQNIKHRLRQLLEGLPEQPDIKDHFTDPDITAKWNAGLQGLDVRFERALTQKDAGRVSIMNALSLIIENYFYEIMSSNRSLLIRMARVWRNPTLAPENQPINEAIRSQVRDIIETTDTIDAEGNVISDLLDLKILVESDELEKANPRHIQKMKLTFNASDRRWVATETAGTKSYLLSKN